MNIELDLDLHEVNYICNCLRDVINSNNDAIKNLEYDSDKTEEEKQGYRIWYEENNIYNKHLSEKFSSAYIKSAHHPSKEGYYGEGIYEIVWIFDMDQYKKIKELSKSNGSYVSLEMFNVRREIVEIYYDNDIPIVRDLRGIEYPLFKMYNNIGSLTCVSKRKYD